MLKFITPITIMLLCTSNIMGYRTVSSPTQPGANSTTSCWYIEQVKAQASLLYKELNCPAPTNEPAYCAYVPVQGGCFCVYATETSCRNTDGCQFLNSCDCGLGGRC